MTSCSDETTKAIMNEFHRQRANGRVSLLNRSRKFCRVSPSGMMLVFVDRTPSGLSAADIIQTIGKSTNMMPSTPTR